MRLDNQNPSDALPSPRPDPGKPPHEPTPDADTATKRFIDWLYKQLWVLPLAGLMALGGVIVDRYSDEVKAWVRGVFVLGVGGTYTLKSFEYPEHSTNLMPMVATVELKDGGGTVFGTAKFHESRAEYTLSGYHRPTFLLISYGGRGPIGAGTIALQSHSAVGKSFVFYGWKTSVECVGPESYLVACPALMFLHDASNPEEEYKNFLQVGYCRKATSHNFPELCEELKKMSPGRK
jgi:hypothetical protein